MDITNHCIRRYVERIKGINNSIEVKEYIAVNQDQIEKEINKMFTYADFVIEAQIGGDKTNKRFYIRDNVIFVVNSDDKVIITLYKIDFGFPEATNRKITKDLIEEIHNLDEQLEEKNKSVSEYVESKKLEIDTWNNEISCLEEKIKCLKRKIKVNECSIDESVQSNNVIRTQLKDYANKLCNSIEYKMDLKELNK